jgi:hypothetical protein
MIQLNDTISLPSRVGSLKKETNERVASAWGSKAIMTNNQNAGISCSADIHYAR